MMLTKTVFDQITGKKKVACATFFSTLTNLYRFAFVTMLNVTPSELREKAFSTTGRSAS